MAENLGSYTEVDAPGRLSASGTVLTVTAADRDEDLRLYSDKGVDHFGATFDHDVDFEVTSSAGAAMNCVVWAVSAVQDDTKSWLDDTAVAVLVRSRTGNNSIQIVDAEDGSNQSYMHGATIVDVPFYLSVERTGETTIQCRIYSDAIRSTLLDTITNAITSGNKYQYVYAFNGQNISVGGSDLDITVENLDLQEGVVGTNMQLNWLDSWRTIDAMQINISDSWKVVAGAQINIGDSWKTVF
tara:strand:- start:1116 stop:1841 length:726 start_codon:yes stop_codon:yes gene_type:complete